MNPQLESLLLAVGAFATYRTPSRITDALRRGGREAIASELRGLERSTRMEVENKTAELADRGINSVLFGDEDYPSSLIVSRGKPLAPVIFYLGNKDLFYAESVGMCGSRHVSPKGLDAATRCGLAVSAAGLVVASGYAQGVDTATHLAALRSGGRTIIVLAEGIDHFRVKRDFATDFDSERTLVVSQFPPTQPWQAHAAMTRNALIYGLSSALIVIEAGDKGGTLAAGEGALSIGKTVFVVDFGDETPGGNRRLLSKGAMPIRSVRKLGDAMAIARTVTNRTRGTEVQLF